MENARITEDYKAELKSILPTITFDKVELLIQYCRDKVSELPVRYVGDEQVYDELKKHLLRGTSLDDSIQEVHKAINIEYQLCRMRLAISISSFDIRTTIVNTQAALTGQELEFKELT